VWNRTFSPDARWRVARCEIAELAALQLRLLSSAASGVRPDGRLVFATCSMFPGENEGTVSAFLGSDRAFELDPFVSPLTGEPCDGRLRIWPWDGDCDAMFVARFRRV